MLDAPEQDYAREPKVPRRTSVVPKLQLRRDFSEDFADDFPEDEDAPGRRKSQGLRLRFRWGMPATKWGKMAAGFALVVLAGLCFGAMLLVRDSVMHDPRFFIQSASSIEIQGNVHLTRDELINIFGEDVERNIFYVSLAQRREQLQALPWVEHATVMRLLPNRLRVSIVERTPVAFVRQGSQIGLVDASGVLLDMPTHGDAHYSFPVVTGIVASDPVSTRAARMKIFGQFTSDLDSSGEHISQKLSEVDLSNPEDVKAVIPDNGKDVLVHFGDTDFLNRYRKFEEHLQEWRTQYPNLASVDMRYERQVVLDMQQDTPTANAGSSVAVLPTATSADGASTAAPAQTATTPVAKTVAKQHAKAHAAAHSSIKKVPVSKWKRAAKAKPHHAATKAHTRVVHHAAGNSRYHSSQVVHP